MTLSVQSDMIVLCDHGGTNGTYVNGQRVRGNVASDNVTVQPGDKITLGEFSFSLGVADWLVPDPPGPLIVVPASGARVDRAWTTREVPSGWNDELWAAYYLRWRSGIVERLRGSSPGAPAPDRHWPIEAARQMCSPTVLQWIRDVLVEHDNSRWFLGCRDFFIDALAGADHGIGPLLAFDIARRHPDESGRELAWSRLEQLAWRDFYEDVATAVFDRVPRDATGLSALIAPVFASAMLSRSRWSARQFFDFLSRPSFAEAAESVVFSLWSQGDDLADTFRLSDGDLMTLEDIATVDTSHTVGVAHHADIDNDTKERWVEHLVSFEVVQPFNQFGDG